MMRRLQTKCYEDCNVFFLKFYTAFHNTQVAHAYSQHRKAHKVTVTGRGRGEERCGEGWPLLLERRREPTLHFRTETVGGNVTEGGLTAACTLRRMPASPTEVDGAAGGNHRSPFHAWGV